MGGNGGTSSTSGMTNWAVPCSAYFSSSSSRICLRLRAVLVEEVLALPGAAVGPLAAGAQRRVEGHVAEQVERVGVGLAGDVGQLVEVDARALPACDDLRPLRGVGPVLPQFAAEVNRVRTFSAV